MGLKLPKAFNYPLSHQDKAGFTVNVQTQQRWGVGWGTNSRKVKRQLLELTATNRGESGESKCGEWKIRADGLRAEHLRLCQTD